MDTQNKDESSEGEITIDVDAGAPLSKKQKRLLKKGKLDLKEKSPGIEGTLDRKKDAFGIWIGNISYDTTKEDLMRFIIVKTKDVEDDETSLKITEADFLRVNIPKKNNKNKGFAYIDFPSPKHVSAAVALSEANLNGRNLLIKDSKSFEGRPSKNESAGASKNPPSRILFVGNLSFDTTEELLEEHFRHCGKIVRIRMATFEDSGKCKGFAFIDFSDESGPTAALKSHLAKRLINRPLRLEYGEDRSKRVPKRADQNNVEEIEEPLSNSKIREEKTFDDESRKPYAPKRKFADPMKSNKRVKSSVALAGAQRESAAIVPSMGKKVKFD